MSLLGPLRRLGRALLLAIVRVLLPARPGHPAIDRRAVRRVLVVRVDLRLGNVLLTTPLVRGLKAGLPHAELHLLVAGRYADAVRGLPYLDRVIPFDKLDALVHPLRFARLLRALRAARYDVAIDASHWHAFSLTHAALVHVSGAPVRVGHARGDAVRFLTHAVPSPADGTGEVPAKLLLLGPLGVAAAGLELDTPLGGDPADRESLAARLRDRGVPGGLRVSVNVGGRKGDHRWPAERFGELARRLAAEGFVPVVYFGPGEDALGTAAVASSGGAAHLAPPTDLRLLAAAFRTSAVVVTGDTGPMHLAAAVRARTVAVLVADDGERFTHAQPGFVAVRPGAGPEGVEEVLRAVRHLTAPAAGTPNPPGPPSLKGRGEEAND